MYFAGKFSIGPLVQELGIGVIGAAYRSIKIHQKSCHIFPQKVAATLVNGSRKGAVGA